MEAAGERIMANVALRDFHGRVRALEVVIDNHVAVKIKGGVHGLEYGINTIDLKLRCNRDFDLVDNLVCNQRRNVVRKELSWRVGRHVQRHFPAAGHAGCVLREQRIGTTA